MGEVKGEGSLDGVRILGVVRGESSLMCFCVCMEFLEVSPLAEKGPEIKRLT